MKKIIFALIGMILFSATLIAQEEVQVTETKKEKGQKQNSTEIRTLAGNNKSNGGYFSFSVGYSEIDNYHAVLFGGRFAWITNQVIGIGFGGTGFLNESHYESVINDDVFLAGGYGGLFIEAIAFPRSPVHLSFPLLIGAGGISYVSSNFNGYDNLIEDTEAFLMIEPGAELEFNMTRYMRLSMGASYRFPTTFNLGTGSSDLIGASSIQGWSYMLTFKFGRF